VPLDPQLLSRLKNALLSSELQPNSKTKEFSIYWGKKNSQVAAAILREFSSPGDVVLDPFIGSGSTLYGAIESGVDLKLIGLDVNEFPISQINFNLQEVNLKRLNEAETTLNKIESLFKSDYTYEIKGQKIEVIKTLLDINGFALEPKKFWVKVGDTLSASELVPGNLIFEELSELFKLRQLDRDFSDDLELPQNSRIAVKAGMKISDLYSPLNFKILLELRNYLKNDLYLKGLISSVLHLAKFTDLGSQSQFPYWYPKQNALDRNLIRLILDKHNQIKRALGKHEATLNINSRRTFEKYQLINIPVQHYIVTNTDSLADIVITDPPYFDQVAYSEYLLVWEFFTGTKVDLENEIVESNRLNSGKSRDVYLQDMELAFKAIRNGSKTDSMMFMYYKDSKLKNINDILEVLSRSGWTFVAQCHVGKKQFSYKQNSSKESTVSGDCLMVFKASEAVRINKSAKIAEFSYRDKTLQIVEEYLRIHGASTISQIYDETLVQELYKIGLLDKFKDPKSLFDLLKAYFDYDQETRTIDVKN
jgi:hypothetical protein